MTETYLDDADKVNVPKFLSTFGLRFIFLQCSLPKKLIGHQKYITMQFFAIETEKIQSFNLMFADFRFFE